MKMTLIELIRFLRPRTEHDSKVAAQDYARAAEDAGFVVTIKRPCAQHGWLTIVEQKEDAGPAEW